MSNYSPGTRQRSSNFSLKAEASVSKVLAIEDVYRILTGH